VVKRRKYDLFLLLSLSFFILIAGCSEKKESPPERNKIIKKVANDYTKAAINNDFNKMYELLSAEDKAAISSEEYLKRQQYLQEKSSKVVMKSGEIKKIKVSKKEAVVEMELETQAPHPVPITKVLVYEKGSWYVVLSPENKQELSIGKSFEEFQKEHPPAGP